MTGYLERLVARSAGGQPGVTPRVRSRFEPAVTAGAEVPEPLPARTRERSAPTPSTGDQPASSDADVGRSSAVVAPQPPPRTAPPIEPARTRRSDTRATPPAPVAASVTARDNPLTGPDRVRADGMHPAERVVEVPTQTTVGAAPSGPLRSGRVRPVVTAVPAAPAAATRPQPEPPTTRSAAPVVRVTIGRVEVSAAVAPPQPAAQPSAPAPAPAPGLSLHDYLRGSREAR